MNSGITRRAARLACIAVLVIAGVASAQAGTGRASVHVLARGAPIHGSNGLYFDAANRLHVASVIGSEIVVLDPDSGRVLDRIGAERGVATPDDLVIGPDGSLYWTTFFTGEVGRLSPDGTKSTAATLPPGVNPITFSDDGRLFVGLDFLGDALYEVDPSGSNPPRLVASNLGFLNGFDWGPDGYLYGPVWTGNRVIKVNVNTGATTTVMEGLVVPAAVKFDSVGRLHVVDTGTGEVVRLTPTTGERKVIARLSPGLDNLAFDKSDRLFVSSFADASIVEVLPNGKPRTVSRGGLTTPGAVAILPGEKGRQSLFVMDQWSLREFDDLTGSPTPLGKQAILLEWPHMTVAPFDDRLVLTSYAANLVRLWDPRSREFGQTYADFALPVNAIQFGNGLVVAEMATGHVVRQGPEGRSTLAALSLPLGLAANDRNLWVADWVQGAVFQVVRDGATLSPPLLIADGLAGPEGLAVGPDRQLLVVEAAAGRLSRIDPMSGQTTMVADGLELGFQTPGLPPSASFCGVAVGGEGEIYVTGDKANVIYRITER